MVRGQVSVEENDRGELVPDVSQYYVLFHSSLYKRWLWQEEIWTKNLIGDLLIQQNVILKDFTFFDDF